jgi:hypothetical protein
MWFSVYASSPLFAFAAVKKKNKINRLQRSAGHATLDTGGWLDLVETIFCLPVRDFHPERNDKLRLPH